MKIPKKHRVTTVEYRKSISLLRAWLVVVFVAIMAAGCQTTAYPKIADVDSVAISKNSQILVIYVSADDCKYCRSFDHHELKDFKATPIFEKVDFRVVNASSFRVTNHDRDWPNDLRWVKSATKVERGTPRFIVAVDGTIVANKFGTRSWHGSIIPLVNRLLVQKDLVS